MAATLVDSYYRFRMFVNCKGGGYVEDYNLLTPVPGGTPSVTSAAKAVCKGLAVLRGILLEGNSRIANMVLSVETAVDDNPAEGYELPHSIAGTPVVLKDPTSGVIETNVGVASDPAIAISWGLDTNMGFIENRTLRSIRASWAAQAAILIPAIVPIVPVVSPVPSGTFPYALIGQFFSYVRDNTALIQQGPAFAPQFNQITFAPPATILDPVVNGLTRRKIGSGWPKTVGRQLAFA